MKGAILAVALFATLAAAGAVQSDVWEALPAEESTANLWVQLRNLEFDPIAPAHLAGIASKNARRVAHVTALQAHADAAQAPLLAFLAEQGITKFSKYWITNAILIPNANRAVAEALDRVTFVEEVYVERMASIDVPVHHNIVDNGPSTSTRNVGWNIELVNAPVAWERGFNGTGFVQGGIDTGVRATHEALADNYRGNAMGTNDYNWFDPNGNPEPFDNNGHGTHVMGSQVGSFDSGIGVAPGSTWIAAKGCASSSCSQGDLTGSGQFMAAPCKVDGSDCDPTMAPDVVQNSWGGGGGQTWFHAIIDSWLALDIVPSFSAGNSGSGCSTIGSPSDYVYAVSVASTDSNSALSSFSSRGPGRTGTGFIAQKPDIAGPGSSIRSAWNTGDTAYNTISGTSMSGPHIASASTIIIGALDGAPCPGSARISCSGACPCTEFVRDVHEKTASQDYGAPSGGSTSCDGVAYTETPNYHYGWGMLDLDAATAFATKARRAE